MTLHIAIGKAILSIPVLRHAYGWLITVPRKRGHLGKLWKTLERVYGRGRRWVIFDIGANDGRSGISYARAFPRTTVHLFEAHPKVAAVAHQAVISAGLKSRATVHQFAASDANGEATFHVSSMPDRNDWRKEVSNSSSLLPPTGHLEHVKHVAFESTITVPTKRLDGEITAGNLPSPDFLHIDVQGAELMVLNGLGAYLKQVRAVWLEVENVELYADQPLAEDISTYLTQAGFQLIWDTTGKTSGDQLWCRR